MDRDREEQNFLHSLATPLGTAVFLADALLESTKNNEINATTSPGPDCWKEYLISTSRRSALRYEFRQF